MTATGYKVFHFGVEPQFIGRWLKAGSEPGFHVWSERESAHAYAKRLNGGVVREVSYKGHIKPISEPDGAAVTAEYLYIL